MLYILSIREQLEIWEEKLDSLASYLDSPWAGMLIFTILAVSALIAINSFSPKK